MWKVATYGRGDGGVFQPPLSVAYLVDTTSLLGEIPLSYCQPQISLPRAYEPAGKWLKHALLRDNSCLPVLGFRSTNPDLPDSNFDSAPRFFNDTVRLLSLKLDAHSNTFGEFLIEAYFSGILRRADNLDFDFKHIQAVDALLRAEPRDLEELGHRYGANGIDEDDETTAKTEEKFEAAVARLPPSQAFFKLYLAERADTNNGWETARVPDEMGLRSCNTRLCGKYGCSSAPPTRTCKKAMAGGETK